MSSRNRFCICDATISEIITQSESESDSDWESLSADLDFEPDDTPTIKDTVNNVNNNLINVSDGSDVENQEDSEVASAFVFDPQSLKWTQKNLRNYKPSPAPFTQVNTGYQSSLISLKIVDR